MSMRITHLRTDNLLKKEEFIIYLTRDATGHDSKLGAMFYDPFLNALMEEGLLLPITSEKGVDYFSPFQIFLIFATSENSLNADGRIAYTETPSYETNGRTIRLIGWCGSAIPELEKGSERYTPWKFAHDLTNFLKLLHSLPIKNRYKDKSYQKRLYTTLPEINYDFSGVGQKTIEQHSLTVEMLRGLRNTIGFFAQSVDPLSEWYEYVKKHPLKRKDLLKGGAARAQRCYELCDLIGEYIEHVTGEKQGSLYRHLASRFIRTPAQDYAHGEDTRAMKYAIEQFRLWMNDKENGQLINASKELVQALEKVEKKLDDYIQRYAHQSWPIGIRERPVLPNLTIENLDEESQILIEKYRQQIGPDWDEFGERSAIAREVMMRLSDISRELQAIFSHIEEVWSDKWQSLWREKENLWEILRMQNAFAGLEYKEQWQLVEAKRLEMQKQIDFWEQLSGEFASRVSMHAGLIFCRVCQNKPVEKHVGERDSAGTHTAGSIICDSCKIIAKSQTSTQPSPLKCRHCNRLLLRYVHDNELSNDVPAKMDHAMKINASKNKIPPYNKHNLILHYGAISVEIFCGQCGEKSIYQLQYGWEE